MSARLAKRQLALTLGDAPADAGGASGKYLAPPKDSKQAKYHRKRTEGFVKRYEKVASARAKRMKPRADGDEEAEESEDDEEGDLFGAAGGSDEDGSDSDGDDGAAGVSGAMALFDKYAAALGRR
eukprot:PRCOL_00002961-RA